MLLCACAVSPLCDTQWLCRNDDCIISTRFNSTKQINALKYANNEKSNYTLIKITPHSTPHAPKIDPHRVFHMQTLHQLTLARTFSNEAGLTSEKQMRNTSWEKKEKTIHITITSCQEEYGKKSPAFMLAQGVVTFFPFNFLVRSRYPNFLCRLRQGTAGFKTYLTANTTS